MATATHGVRCDSVRSRVAGGGSPYVHPRYVHSTPRYVGSYGVAHTPDSYLSQPHGGRGRPLCGNIFPPGVPVCARGLLFYPSGLQVINFVVSHVSPEKRKMYVLVCIYIYKSKVRVTSWWIACYGLFGGKYFTLFSLIFR